VRLAWGERRNPFGARSVPYRFTPDDAEIPEAPWALLPVVVGAAGLVVWHSARRWRAGG
jgi:hypothetical protein